MGVLTRRAVIECKEKWMKSLDLDCGLVRHLSLQLDRHCLEQHVQRWGKLDFFFFFVEAGMPILYLDKHAGMERDGLSLMESAMAFHFFVSCYV